MFRHPALAVGSYSSGQPAARTESTGGVYRPDGSPSIIEKVSHCQHYLQGVRAVKESGLEGVRYVFIQPPSLEVLEERLRARGTETEEAIEKVLIKNHTTGPTG